MCVLNSVVICACVCVCVCVCARVCVHACVRACKVRKMCMQVYVRVCAPFDFTTFFTLAILNRAAAFLHLGYFCVDVTSFCN